MAILKLSLVLTGILIAALVMLPMMNVAGEKIHDDTPVPAHKEPEWPEHHIPPEYWANASPATPLPESEMISIIISESTLSAPGQDTPQGIVEIPLSQLNLSSRFVKSDEYENWYTETDLNADEPVVLIRMPQTMYDRHISMSQNDILSLPETSFCRFYDNLSDLNSHIQRDGDVVKVLPD